MLLTWEGSRVHNKLAGNQRDFQLQAGLWLNLPSHRWSHTATSQAADLALCLYKFETETCQRVCMLSCMSECGTKLSGM